MAVLAVNIEEAIDLHLTIEQNENVVLVFFAHFALVAHEDDVFLFEQIDMLSLEVTVD